MQPGSVVRIPFHNSTGCEKSKARPGIVIAVRDDFAITVPLTTRRPTLPTHVPSFVFGRQGIVACEHVNSFLVEDLKEYSEVIAQNDFRRIHTAFQIAIGLIPISQEPPRKPKFFRGSLVSVRNEKWLIISNDIGNYHGNTLIVCRPSGFTTTIDTSSAELVGETRDIPEVIKSF